MSEQRIATCSGCDGAGDVYRGLSDDDFVVCDACNGSGNATSAEEVAEIRSKMKEALADAKIAEMRTSQAEARVRELEALILEVRNVFLSAAMGPGLTRVTVHRGRAGNLERRLALALAGEPHS